MKAPLYLALINGRVFAYDVRDELLIHISLNRPDHARLFKRDDRSFVIRYLPVTEAELRGAA